MRTVTPSRLRPQQAPTDFAQLPPTITERLAEHEVHSLSDWRRLGAKRFALWGVTRRMAATIDALARQVP
jgi:hypothetical protein